MPATGTIARTVTNVRAGARHAGGRHRARLALLLIVLVAAPLARTCRCGAGRHPALRGLEHGRVARVRAPAPLQRGYRTILLGTFLLTVVFDLTIAVRSGWCWPACSSSTA
jgi:SulP family sulfate permease